MENRIALWQVESPGYATLSLSENEYLSDCNSAMHCGKLTHPDGTLCVDPLYLRKEGKKRKKIDPQNVSRSFGTRGLRCSLAS